MESRSYSERKNSGRGTGSDRRKDGDKKDNRGYLNISVSSVNKDDVNNNNKTKNQKTTIKNRNFQKTTKIIPVDSRAEWTFFSADGGTKISFDRMYEYYDVVVNVDHAMKDQIYKNYLSLNVPEAYECKFPFNYRSYCCEYAQRSSCILIVYDKNDTSIQICDIGLALYTIRRIKKSRKYNCTRSECSLIFNTYLGRKLPVIIMNCPFPIHTEKELDFYDFICPKFHIKLVVENDMNIVQLPFEFLSPARRQFILKLYPTSGNQHGFRFMVAAHYIMNSAVFVFPDYVASLEMYRHFVTTSTVLRDLQMVLIPNGDCEKLENMVDNLTNHFEALHNLHEDFRDPEEIGVAKLYLKNLSYFDFSRFLNNASYMWPYLLIYGIKKWFTHKIVYEKLVDKIFDYKVGCKEKVITSFVMDEIRYGLLKPFIKMGNLRDRIVPKTDFGYYSFDYLISGRILRPFITVGLWDNLQNSSWFNATTHKEKDGSYDICDRTFEDKDIVFHWIYNNRHIFRNPQPQTGKLGIIIIQVRLAKLQDYLRNTQCNYIPYVMETDICADLEFTSRRRGWTTLSMRKSKQNSAALKSLSAKAASLGLSLCGTTSEEELNHLLVLLDPSEIDQLGRFTIGITSDHFDIISYHY